MLKKFATKQLIFIALMAALLLVVNFSIGAGIIAITGIPGSSAFITGITNALIFSFVVLTLRKFGTGTLLYLIYGILALPTHMAGGPPGFIWKVIILAIAGLSFDIFVYIFKYKVSGFVIGGIVSSAIGLFGLLLAFYLIGMPEFDKLYPVIKIMYLAWVLLAFVGLWLGFLLYKKLKKKALIKQFSS